MPTRQRPSVALAIVFAALLAVFPPSARAWKVDTHVFAANLVLEEAFSTMTVDQVIVTDTAVKNRIKEELRRAFGNNFGNRDRIDYLDNAWVQWIYIPPADRLIRLSPAAQRPGMPGRRIWGVAWQRGQ